MHYAVKASSRHTFLVINGRRRFHVNDTLALRRGDSGAGSHFRPGLFFWDVGS